MIPLLKSALTVGAAGMTAVLAMCATVPQKTVHHYSTHHHHHQQVVEEHYGKPAVSPTPAPAPTVIIIHDSMELETPIPKSSPTPVYKTTVRHQPPWAPNARPDQ